MKATRLPSGERVMCSMNGVRAKISKGGGSPRGAAGAAVLAPASLAPASLVAASLAASCAQAGPPSAVMVAMALPKVNMPRRSMVFMVLPPFIGCRDETRRGMGLAISDVRLRPQYLPMATIFADGMDARGRRVEREVSGELIAEPGGLALGVVAGDLLGLGQGRVERHFALDIGDAFAKPQHAHDRPVGG